MKITVKVQQLFTSSTYKYIVNVLFYHYHSIDSKNFIACGVFMNYYNDLMIRGVKDCK
jgi:hypothetical protein